MYLKHDGFETSTLATALAGFSAVSAESGAKATSVQVVLWASLAVESIMAVPAVASARFSMVLAVRRTLVISATVAAAMEFGMSEAIAVEVEVQFLEREGEWHERKKGHKPMMRKKN